MNKNQHYDDMFWDSLILRSINEVDNSALDSQAKLANEALSPEEITRLNALTKKAAQKEFVRQDYKPSWSSVLKASACFLVFIAVSATVMMGVSAWRTQISEFIFTVLEDHGVFSSNTQTTNIAKNVYIPTRIPGSYTKSEVVLDNENTLIMCYYGEDFYHSITYQLFYTQSNVFIDTENADIQNVEHNGQTLTIIKKESERQLLGIIPGTDFQYLIVGDLSDEEIIDIANSIQIKKEE